MQKFLSDIDLGDKRPTQLLNEVSSLTKNKVTDSFLQSLRIQRWLMQFSAILQASDAILQNKQN